MPYSRNGGLADGAWHTCHCAISITHFAAEIQNRNNAHHRRQHETTVLLIKQGFWTHCVPVLVGWLKLVKLYSSVTGAYHLWS